MNTLENSEDQVESTAPENLMQETNRTPNFNSEASGIAVLDPN
jgi:hypothetical protein